MLIKDTMFNNSCVANLATILSDVQQKFTIPLKLYRNCQTLIISKDIYYYLTKKSSVKK